MSWKIYEGYVNARRTDWLNAQPGFTSSQRVPIIAESTDEAHEVFEDWLAREYGEPEPEWSVKSGDVEIVLKILNGQTPLSSVNRR